MVAFALDRHLEADTYPIGQLPLSRVLMMNDARFPWLILVPERPDLAEIIDLDEAAQGQLMREIAAASQALRTLFNPDKLNVGALGNRVRQLHVHVIARFVSDAAWAGPVWGVGQAQPYPPHMAGVAVDGMIRALLPLGLKEFKA
jgi:diadenosine tetraphosphate (Ap4A) HIT family hydrolase